MSKFPGLSLEQFALIRSFFPSECQVKIFGSRARGSFRLNSDLDVCIVSDISRAALAAIKESFEESNLPFTVDVVLYRDCSSDFKKNIDRLGIFLDI